MSFAESDTEGETRADAVAERDADAQADIDESAVEKALTLGDSESALVGVPERLPRIAVKTGEYVIYADAVIVFESMEDIEEEPVDELVTLEECVANDGVT